ncbi:MAG: chemotaxis protein MotA [Chromatiaceae bacterium]|nr:MAG: chemotaxis protein MotA [Chromatiaceae bacterium]
MMQTTSSGAQMRKKILLVLGAAGLLALITLLASTVGLAWANLPGLMLVVGGTWLASVIGHSPKPVMDLLKRLPELFRQPPVVHLPTQDHKRLLKVADLCRRGHVRIAEDTAKTIGDPFLQAGARLALDRHSGDELVRMLQWRIRRQKESDHRDIRILRTMATFAPAFGMLGTLVGLVALLGNLGSSGLEYVGLAMGFALMSTLYGLLAANLIFKPLALKLEDRSRHQLLHMNFLLDAVLMLHERQHPVMINEFLESVPRDRDEPAEWARAPVRALPQERLRA